MNSCCFLGFIVSVQTLRNISRTAGAAHLPANMKMTVNNGPNKSELNQLATSFKSALSHWLSFIFLLWCFTVHSQPRVILIEMHCSCINLYLVTAVYHRFWWNLDLVHRSSLLIYHNSYSSVIIYYCVTCRITVLHSFLASFVLYFKDTELLMSSKRTGTSSFFAHSDINTDIFTELKSGALIFLLNVCVVQGSWTFLWFEIITYFMLF